MVIWGTLFRTGKGGGDFFFKLHCHTPHMMIFVRGGKLCKEIARVENDKQLQKKIHPSPPGSRNNEGSGQKGWQLTAVYIIKARNTDQQFCGTAIGTTGPVEAKLASLGDMMGLVVGAFGGCSEDLHTLIRHLAISRVRVAGPKKGKRGQERSEEAELAITTSFLRRILSVAGVRAQAKILLSRLEVIGPVAVANAATGRHLFAVNLERRMANQSGLTS